MGSLLGRSPSGVWPQGFGHSHDVKLRAGDRPGCVACRPAASGCGAGEPVRAENPVRGSDQQGCFSGRPAVMITHHVPAVRLPPDHAGGLMAAAVLAQGGVAGCRDLGPAPPARRTATAAAAPPELELGGPALLAVLLDVIRERRTRGCGCWSPQNTVLRWHRNIVRGRWAARSMRGKWIVALDDIFARKGPCTFSAGLNLVIGTHIRSRSNGASPQPDKPCLK